MRGPLKEINTQTEKDIDIHVRTHAMQAEVDEMG